MFDLPTMGCQNRSAWKSNTLHMPHVGGYFWGDQTCIWMMEDTVQSGLSFLIHCLPVSGVAGLMKQVIGQNV